jgi:predicted glycosyltransferase involved in capsule biosynthesis
MVYLLYKGFGVVCLRNFHFYGFKKDLIRKIGFFDERFVGGGFEDKDFGNRLLENDIALYESTESQEIYMATSWNNQTKAVNFFSKKWKETHTSWKRLLPDEKYDYDLGPMVNEKNNWLPFKESLLLSSLESHQRLKYFNDKPIDLTNLKSSK